ncbi:MAG TPA: cyclic dehypoxanthinyl futalosine synthase [Candidatus Hydrogenedentes bacterium]|nr:cyclic dehypoxanthinyl futalosine synthase [Candidatus Hydrogenedentota bacterium]HNT86501.1 cyclic dehypoxanthinyl futalosine synthase [Candidatus Hydrogenedentota bacterium]
MGQERIGFREALYLLLDAPQLALMEQADAVRRARHPGDDVTFVIDTNPNYTNVCVTECTFCSFYRKPGHPEAYTLTPEQVAAKVARAHALGATTVLLQGGHNPALPFHYYFDLIAAIRAAAPDIHLHLFSPPEIAHIAETCGRTREAVLGAFWDAGMRTMPGGGAEILVDDVRRGVSPKKISSDDWIDIMRAAHRIGMKTSATMTYGHRESPEDIIDHLLRLRRLQDETGGFYAFIPWSLKPGRSPLSRLVAEEELPSLYVRVIAVARLVLDNFPHIQASWFGEGWRAGQLALHAGADDFGGLLLEENVLRQADHNVATTLDAVLTAIRDAGFTPVQRTTTYERLRRFDDADNPFDGPILRARGHDGAPEAEPVLIARA